jgi:hypothetical protein
MDNQCTAHNRNGTRCKRASVEGRTVCHMHGAGGNQLQKVVEANVRHGRRSKYTVPIVLAEYERLAADPDHLDLSDEISLSRATLEAFLRNLENQPRLTAEVANQVQSMAESVARVVEKENKRRGTISQNELVVLLAQVTDVFKSAIYRHIRDEAQQDAVWADVRHGLARLVTQGDHGQRTGPVEPD